MNKLSKIIVVIMCIITVVMMIWGAVSFIDIIVDNCAPNPVHHPYNLFNVIVEIGEKING